jgi:hypothetical protein
MKCWFKRRDKNGMKNQKHFERIVDASNEPEALILEFKRYLDLFLDHFGTLFRRF